MLRDGETAVKAVCRVVELLEDLSHFNAGRGAIIWSDGMIRLSASLMDGNKQQFSGVMMATHMIHSSKLAYTLDGRGCYLSSRWTLGCCTLHRWNDREYP
ncbi:MAG TPA: isoaspartyl peptidase/L-asparaginase [Candidatus Wunengus californicus]|uniref:isoaspartyl peptidase/L-asparaginase n=1 Tax=Candidatus Wunengus californicus TaxID=3367619 RepID=UPI004026B6DC